jgi:hypothetical protein
LVSVLVADPGDEVLALLPPSAAAVTNGDMLVSNGDGTLAKALGSGAEELYVNVADSASVTNTSTIAAFDKSYTIPANTLQIGDVVHIRAQVLAPTTNSTDTLTVTLKIGAVVIIATAAVDVANNDIAEIDAFLVIRTIGASGTWVGGGTWVLGVPGTATVRGFNVLSTAIDTTATQQITVSATWSVASASDIATLKILQVELDRTSGNRVMAFARETVDNSAGAGYKQIKVGVL